jgi:uroporphyrinogen-III synthase
MEKAASAPALAGWYVISLRPSGSHGPVRRAAAALGARTLAVSTLALRERPAGPALQAALACPLVVVTSPAAVVFASRQATLRAQPGQTWFALGEGSARALARAGVPGATTPAGGSDSESLLALPQLQAPLTSVGLVSAPGGRGLIPETLASRGAVVHRADVYRREPIRPRPAQLAALAALPPDSALLVTSSEAFDGLWSVLDGPAREQLRARPAVASSPRLAVQLAALGFQAIVPAAGAAPGLLLEALAADVARGRFR